MSAVQMIHHLPSGAAFREPMQFIHHTGRSRFRPPLPIDLSQLDTFAELLSEGLGVGEAARRMGKDYSYGNAMLQRIRARLGPQAV